MKHSIFLSLALVVCYQILAQTHAPKFKSLKEWQIVNRTAITTDDSNRKALQMNGAVGDGMAILKDYTFSSGTIEFDVRGKNAPQQSFVGLAFHIQNEKTFDAIYFRPFNFMNPDTLRRSRAVQYVSMPDHPWEKLRAQFPGKYEHMVNPVPNPDDWFHVKIIVDGARVSVFVNGSETPSLEVEKLNAYQTGQIALWVGNTSDGGFANLQITPSK